MITTLRTGIVSISAVLVMSSNGMAVDSMAYGENGYRVSPPLLTIGESLYNTTGDLNPTTEGVYTPVGVLDGIGGYEKDKDTVRIFVNHELLNYKGNQYEVGDGAGGTFTMTGARISYFDIDKYSKDIIDGGLAYNTIYDAFGNSVSDTNFLLEGFGGFSRFCSSVLVEAKEFGKSGLRDTIYFSGEEDGGAFNPVGGAEWALDVESGELWHVPAMGRGAWENIVPVSTGNRRTVAFILADDSSPFDFDADGVKEAAPLYLYLGKKSKKGDFLDRNGLRNGRLFVFVANNGARTPLEFRGMGATLRGKWVEVNNLPTGTPSEDGSTGYDEYGYPTQGNLWVQAENRGAFGFSRPEDVAYNPRKPSQVVLASTGVDTYAVDPATGDGADTFGTVYLIDTNFKKMTSKLTILYDGDDDPSRSLRSPDNLDWADNGFIYVQEDEAEEDSLTGEVLFGPGAANPEEAGIVRINPKNGELLRVATIDRTVVIDASIDEYDNAAFDLDEGFAGEWESSGVLDVSRLFDQKKGSLFLFNVQAHGIEDQSTKGNLPNPNSRLNDGDLVEGGQLLFLYREKKAKYHGKDF